MELKHSYSSISCFETCPKQFQEKYILKTVKFKPNEAAAYGQEGHKVCEDAVKAKTLPTGRWSHVAPVIQSIYNAAGDAPLHAEYELGITQDKEPTTFWKGWLRGKLDLTYKPVPDKAVILDYKFAAYKPSKYNLEMDVFSYLLMKNDEEVEAIKRGLLWLKQESPGSPTITTVTRKEDFNRIEDNVLGKIQFIERSVEFDNFPCKVTGLCGWCDVTSCPHQKARR